MGFPRQSNSGVQLIFPRDAILMEELGSAGAHAFLAYLFFREIRLDD